MRAGGCGSDGALCRSCHPCPPACRAPGSGRSLPCWGPGAAVPRRQRLDGTGRQRRVAASVPSLPGGRTERGCCLISRGRRVGHVEAFFFLFAARHPPLLPSPLAAYDRGEGRSPACGFPGASPVRWDWGLGGLFLRKRGLRCGRRRRAAGRAPSCTFSVRAGLSLGLAVNHPARLSQKRGTATAASRAPPAGTRPPLGAGRPGQRGAVSA